MPMQVAFVIMPFAADFDSIYTLFIKETLEQAGFEVRRADDIRNQANIMGDVVRGIFSADLIVADVTDANPNVYYELGLAHAFRKRVIVLTQSVKTLPFDLQSYRVIPYTTHFAQMEQAKAALLDLGREVLAGRVLFGSPVSDHLPPEAGSAPLAPASAQPPLPIVAPADEEPEARGFLDHVVAVQDGFAQLAALVGAVTAENERMTANTAAATQLLQAANSSKSADSAREARDIIREFGSELLVFGERVSSQNVAYGPIQADIQESMEFLVRNTDVSSADGKARLAELQAMFIAMEGSVSGAVTLFESLADSLSSLQNLESQFHRARKVAVRELRQFADNTRLTLAMATRVRALIHELLGEANDGV